MIENTAFIVEQVWLIAHAQCHPNDIDKIEQTRKLKEEEKRRSTKKKKWE